MNEIIWTITGLGAITVAVFIFGFTWLLASRSTEGIRISNSGPLRRAWRWYRSIWLRAVLLPFSWPHLVEVLLRTPHAETAQTPSSEVWRYGSVRLMHYGASPVHRQPVLLVHSVVTKPWILDLVPGRSLVEHLVDEGFDVFLLDWGDIGRDEGSRGLADYIRILTRAEEEVLHMSEASRLHLIGYCLGGTICLGRAAAFPDERITSVAALAAPVDFAVPGALQRILTHWAMKPVTALDGSGCVPAAIVRETFHALRPRALKTIRNALSRRTDPEFWSTYAALSRWVWEHRRLPGALFLDLVELFRTNSFFGGSLRFNDRSARLLDIRVPVLMGVAERDHIVPSGSSHALTTVSGLDVEVVSCPTGHVSMISGSGGRTVLWPALARWLRDRQPSDP